MSVIEVQHITKDYGNHKGNFDVSFTVEKGEVVGFLGPNGAGKTTTIRQLMGFIKPDKGSVTILGMDCFQDCASIQKTLGYLPGEIAFMEDMDGMAFLHFLADMKQIKDFSIAEKLIHYFELDPKGKMKKMSKGMKQKIGLVAAFMQDPEILILDEPTSGLDPLMQSKFVRLIKEAKKQGKTILMSSHMFEEVEHTCDRVVIIKDGEIMAVESMEDMRNTRKKLYDIRFSTIEEAKRFASQYPNALVEDSRVSIAIHGKVQQLIQELHSYEVLDLATRTQTLEELFMQYYGGDVK